MHVDAEDLAPVEPPAPSLRKPQLQPTFSSRRAEQCSFYYQEPSNPVSVLTSSSLERQCSFLTIKPLYCFTSRAASACTFFAKETDTPAAVITTGVLEKQCSFWSEFDVEKFDLFTTEPTQMFLTDEEEMVPLEASKPRTLAPRVLPLFTSRQAAKCSFYGKAPSVPVASFASSRAEKQCDFGCAVWDDEGLLFLVDRNLNTMPEDPVVVPVQDYWRREVNCQNIRLLEKMCSFHDVTPKPTFSSKQASRCTFYAKEPSKPPSVITNGMLEKMCSFHTVRPMPLTSSRAVEQCTFYCKEPVRAPFDVAAFDVFGTPVQMQTNDDEVVYPVEPTQRAAPVQRSMPLYPGRAAAACTFYAKEPSKPTRVVSSSALERQCSFLPDFDIDRFD